MTKKTLQTLIVSLETISIRSGKIVAWLTIVMVIVTFSVVILRYALSSGSVALQDSIHYFHALIFMLGAAYTLQKNEHVRIDIFYQKMTALKKAWVDLFGTVLLLIPMCVFIAIQSFDYIVNSWAVKEGSVEAGGLPFVYLLKSVIILMTVLLVNQGFALILRSIQTIRQSQLQAEH